MRAQRITTLIPVTAMIESTTVPTLTAGGIANAPVTIETMPVGLSAKTNGSEKMQGAFTTAILSYPPFHGLLDN